MSRNKVLGWTLGVGLLAGSAVAVAQNPPPPPPSTGEVRVTVVKEQPPPVKTETVIQSTRPAPNYLWIPGAWEYQATGWTWVAGHWEMPPAAEVQWVAPVTTRVEHGYRYVPGHWTSQKVITYENGRKVIIQDNQK